MTEDVKMKLKVLGSSDHGEALKEYLDERLKAMDVDDAKDWSDVLARRKVRAMIKETFYFLEGEQPIKKRLPNQYM